jgi:hypothetical protein
VGSTRRPSYPIVCMADVVYICRVSRFARRSRGQAKYVAAPLILVSMLGAGAIGCGSGQHSDTREGAGRESSGEGTSTGTPGAVAEAPPAAAGDKSSPRQSGSERRTSGESREHSQDGGREAASDASGTAAAKRRALGRKAAEDCPSGIDAAQCGMLVEASAKEGESDPHALNEPRNCAEAMSQSNCESMLAAQKAAAERSAAPVSVDECVRNPTPRCEAMLGPMFEEQRAASQEAGK